MVLLRIVVLWSSCVSVEFLLMAFAFVFGAFLGRLSCAFLCLFCCCVCLISMPSFYTILAAYNFWFLFLNLLLLSWFYKINRDQFIN